MPKATSSPSISDEQKERMIRNRKLAEERRLARLEKLATEASKPPSINIVDADGITTEHNITKKNRSNVIDSSDEECNVTAVNQSVSVDMHANINHSHDKDASLTNKSIESKNTETEQTLDVDMDVSDKVSSLPTNHEQITDQENISDGKTLNNGENCEISTNNIEFITDKEELGKSNGENDGKVDLHNVSDNGNVPTDDIVRITDNDKVNNDIDIGTNKGKNSSNNVKDKQINQETDETNKDSALNEDVSQEPEISLEHSANISSIENKVQSPSKDETIEDSEEINTKVLQTEATQPNSEINKDMIESINTAEVEDIMDVDFSDDF